MFCLTILKQIYVKMATETNDVIPTIPISAFAAGAFIVKEPAAMAILVNHAERPETFNG